eukprot:CAMPEP_0196584292 /NCGR_PEP_ID=MMETSP1081-20130531/46532_1 /TAXON_ID=36882 /ORGANISM="Pyramimonas amylifera, Strain CCMP720" /LENGTH=280 /DNA_ID=CAMNT_0041905447 /DNA_START=113 /DNA_END=952 /DNA_ORIENTATION=-
MGCFRYFCFWSRGRRHRTEPSGWKKGWDSSIRAKEAQLVFLGLDGSGKSSLLFSLQQISQAREIAPPSLGLIWGGGGGSARESPKMEPLLSISSSQDPQHPLTEAGGGDNDFSNALCLERRLLPAGGHAEALPPPGSSSSSEDLNPVSPPPTLRVQRCKVSVAGMEVRLVEVPGRPAFRGLPWREDLKEATAVVMVVDSSDSLRMSVAKKELWSLLPDLRSLQLPCLVLANKQDLSDSWSVAAVRGALQLESLQKTAGVKCSVRPCSAMEPVPVRDALEW